VYIKTNINIILFNFNN